jgi:ketosteroid isomerase-like protein
VPPDAITRMYGELTRRRVARDSLAMTTKDLDAFFEVGWNAHDVDRLMTFMADDCVFESVAGPDACGTRHVGHARVREAFARVFAAFPDARFGAARHFVSGDRGLSEWLFTGTAGDGRKVEVNGCDVFTFRGGKIALKSSFFKNRMAS